MGGHLNAAGRVFDSLPGSRLWFDILEFFFQGCCGCPRLGQGSGGLLQFCLGGCQRVFQVCLGFFRFCRLGLCLAQPLLRLLSGCALLGQLPFQPLAVGLVFPGELLNIVQHILAVESPKRSAAKLACLLLHGVPSFSGLSLRDTHLTTLCQILKIFSHFGSHLTIFCLSIQSFFPESPGELTFH